VIAHEVHVVVVAFRSPDQLAHTLAALDRQFAVTVVDNSSSAEVRAVAHQWGATYVDAGSNRGFAAGVNIALRRLARSRADVLLLNPDAVIKPGGVRKLSWFLHTPENAYVAAVAPRLEDTAGSQQKVVWPLPAPGRMWLEAFGLGGIAIRNTFVVGAVLLLRREALDDIGLFDERFFLYAEEADWQRRALASGWVSAVNPDVVAEHAGAGTSVDSRWRETLFHAAQQTYITKWYGRGGWRLYRVAALLGAGVRTLMLTRDRRKEAARRTLLYFRGPRRCATSELK
jgi:GT2 family glycosyltransferase